MYEYNISKFASNRAFKNICDIIEKTIKNINTEKPIVDVDGLVIKIYSSGNLSIKVYNDYEVDAVYIDSDIDLSSILQDMYIV